MVGQSEELPDPLTPPGESGQDKEPTRKPRRDKGEIRLNDRDLLVLQWIGEQYAVRFDTLQVLLGHSAQQVTKVENLLGDTSARRVLDRWKQENLVQDRKILSGQPKWVWLTAHGLRQMNLPYKPKDPVAGQLLHLHLVNRIRLHAEAKYAHFKSWRGERQMRYEHWNDKAFHVPDGEVILTNNEVIAVEIERTLKSRRRIDAIVKQLDHQYGKVWYFVSAETRAAVQAATDAKRGKFSLLSLEDFVK